MKNSKKMGCKLVLGLTMSLILGAIHSASAALPPYGQSIDMINAVLKSSELAKAIGSAKPIVAIVYDKNKEMTYNVIAEGNCVVKVSLKAIAPAFPGPVKFEVESIDTSECAPSSDSTS